MAARRGMPSPSHAHGAGPSLSRKAMRKRGDSARSVGWVTGNRHHLVTRLEDGAAVDNRALHPALDRTPIERSVLRLRAELVGADEPPQIRVEQHEVGRRAD